MKKIFVFIITVCSFTIACKDKAKESKVEETETGDNTKTIDPKADSLLKAKNLQDSLRSVHRKDSILLKLTQNILLTLKNKNYSAFANYIHPVSGIRFSPYGYVDTLSHLRFSKEKFIATASADSQEMIVWGVFDGTGDPIKMTFNNYMQRFVYDVDFAKPEKRSVNEFIGSGNSLNNLDSVYKDCDFTESHFSGFEKKYAGMDWKTLRLVFKERNGKYLLVGIIHDEWTI
jgi:hypothetical protein